MRGLLLALVACGGSSEPPPAVAPDVTTGSLMVAGKAQELVGCKPLQTPVGFDVVVMTKAGALRFRGTPTEVGLLWSTDKDGATPGEPLACEKLDRVYASHARPDNTAMWRGMLDFRCSGPKSGDVTGKLELSCGHITAAENAELDQLKKQQRGSGAGP